MLHDKDGVAYDAATQAMLQSLIVRLTGPHDAAIVAPSSLELEPGEATSLPLWVTNLGREAWGQKAVPGTKTIDSRRLVGGSPATRARIVGSWVSLGGIDDPAQLDAAAAASVTPTGLPPAFAPRAVTKANLVMFAPSTAGDYLLVIDIVTPEVGSLAAQGVEPVTVRIHVAPKPVEPSPSPTVQPTAAAPSVAAPSVAAPSVAPAAGASVAPSAAPSAFAEPTERR
jgi:hypothetical protein